jgi:hypothetical protein
MSVGQIPVFDNNGRCRMEFWNTDGECISGEIYDILDKYKQYKPRELADFVRSEIDGWMLIQVI